MKYDWVTKRIAVGSSVDSMYDARALAADGITRVLNLRENTDEAAWFEKIGLVYSGNPTDDDSDEPKSAEWFQSSFDFIMAGLSIPGCKIYIHCRNGHNRAPSTVYFFLRALGWSKKDAYDLVVSARPKAKDMRWRDDADVAIKFLEF